MLYVKAATAFPLLALELKSVQIGEIETIKESFLIDRSVQHLVSVAKTVF